MNKQLIIGRLGKDVETKKTTNDKSMADFSVATEEYAGKDDSGKAKYATTWHNVRAFGGTADFAGKFKKGDTIYVEGRTEHSEYEGKHYTRVIAEKVEAFGKPGGAAGNSNGGSNTSSEQKSTKNTSASNSSKASSSASAPADNDDLPF